MDVSAPGAAPWPVSGWPNASVVLRPEAIRERLLRLEQVVSRLQQLCVLGGRELREDFRSAWTVERGLQLAAEIVFDAPQIAVTPGQAVVFYQDDVVVGGGWIDS